MSDKRALGILAAIAAIALVAGVPGAAADELSDLRANNELLQRRLDRIEGASTYSANGGSAKTVGSPAADGGSFPRSFLVPGTDTSVRVGGSISEIFRYRRR